MVAHSDSDNVNGNVHQMSPSPKQPTCSVDEFKKYHLDHNNHTLVLLWFSLKMLCLKP